MRCRSRWRQSNYLLRPHKYGFWGQLGRRPLGTEVTPTPARANNAILPVLGVGIELPANWRKSLFGAFDDAKGLLSRIASELGGRCAAEAPSAQPAMIAECYPAANPAPNRHLDPDPSHDDDEEDDWFEIGPGCTPMVSAELRVGRAGRAGCSAQRLCVVVGIAICKMGNGRRVCLYGLPPDQSGHAAGAGQRAHMHNGGYGGQALRGSLAEAWSPATDVSADFGPDLVSAAPQPDGCAF